MRDVVEVPVWLALLRWAMLAATMLAMVLYPLLPAQNRKKHAETIGKLADRVEGIRNSLALLLSRAARLLRDAFGHLYGGPQRMVFVSTCLTLLYIMMVGLLNWNWIVETRIFYDEKLSLDRSVEPELRYAPEDVKRAKEFIIVGIKDTAQREWRWNDDLSKEIRQSFDERHSRWFAKLKGHDHAREIAFLTLLHGYSWDEGPRWSSILGLVIFNVLLDLLVVVAVRTSLERLAKVGTVVEAALCCAAIVGITVLAYAIFLIPTSYLFEGYGASYWLLLLGLPVAAMFILATAFGFSAFVMRFLSLVFNVSSRFKSDDNSFFSVAILAVISWIFFVPLIREVLSLGPPPLDYPTGSGAIPYGLASCCVAPGLLTLTCLTLAFLIRIGGGAVAAPLVGYFRFVLETPTLVGFTMLALPSAIVELFYQAFEFLKGHPELFSR